MTHDIVHNELPSWISLFITSGVATSTQYLLVVVISILLLYTTYSFFLHFSSQEILSIHVLTTTVNLLFIHYVSPCHLPNTCFCLFSPVTAVNRLSDLHTVKVSTNPGQFVQDLWCYLHYFCVQYNFTKRQSSKLWCICLTFSCVSLHCLFIIYCSLPQV